MRKSTTKNKMIFTTVFLLLSVLTIFIGCKKEQPQESQQAVASQKTEIPKKLPLRILYAGISNTDRAKDFVDFLKTYFQQVETTDYNTFTGSYPSDFDVAIIDHDGADTRAPRVNINRQYARATVTVGVPGAFICSNLSLKTGYL
jgi:UDP-N-acetylmuramyl pentapeptide synthase